MMLLAGLALVHTKPNSSLSIVKYNSICCSPNHLACCDDYFPEDDIIKICSYLQYHVHGAEVQVPIDLYGSPTISAKGTLKKETETSFFTAQATQDTAVIIQIHVLSP